MIVVGITGRNCAGKDSVADVFIRNHFERHSLSDALRVELQARGVPITRHALISLGRELRETEGPAALANRMMKMIRSDRVVLVSVRCPAEVEALRKLPGFVLVAVDASREERFRREIERRREGPAPTFEEFLAFEAREESTDPNAQQIGAAMAQADRTIVNNGSLTDLQSSALVLLEELVAGSDVSRHPPVAAGDVSRNVPAEGDVTRTLPAEGDVSPR